MIVFLNLGSLVLGLFAWILPVVNLMRYGKQENWNWVALSFASISASAILVCFQIFEIAYRVKIADWSALMDTMNAVAVGTAVLVIITTILNVIVLIVYRGRTAE